MIITSGGNVVVSGHTLRATYPKCLPGQQLVLNYLAYVNDTINPGTSYLEGGLFFMIIWND